MIKTKNDINSDVLYNSIKSTIGFHRSKKHLEWLRELGEPHHLFGSYTGIKTSDYAAIPLTREQHNEAEKNKSYFAVTHLHILIKILIQRIIELENNKS